MGGSVCVPYRDPRSTTRCLPWDSEAKRKGSADRKVGRMAKARNITAGYRCDSQESKNHLCEAFVPPRPRDRHRLKKGDSRAGRTRAPGSTGALGAPAGLNSVEQVDSRGRKP